MIARLSALSLLIIAGAACAAPMADDAETSEVAATTAGRRVSLRYAVGSVVVVEVDDLPGAKQVDVRYRAPSGAWTDAPAKPLRSIAGRALYYVDDLPTSNEQIGNYTLRFAVRYRVDGKEHWDNNGRRDYLAQTTDGFSGKCELLACEYAADGSRTCVNQYCKPDGTPEPGAGVCTPRPANCGASSRPLLAPMGKGVDVVLTDVNLAAHMGEIQFGLLVRDLAPQKKVSVVFRSDKGGTQTMNAVWREGSDSGERWWVPNGHLSLDYDKRVTFHVEVEQGGRTTRYDANGQDFECRRRGFELECSALDVITKASWE